MTLKVPGLPSSLVLKALGLPFVPVSQTRQRAGPVLPAYPRYRRHHDGAESQPLPEAAAPEHMNQQSQPDQSQRRLSVRICGLP